MQYPKLKENGTMRKAPHSCKSQNEEEAVAEIKMFVRSEQLPLLKKVLSSIASHFGIKKKDMPRILWICGLKIKHIERIMEYCRLEA